MVTLDLNSPALLDPDCLPTAPIEALYVHVPFCFHKCHYCDFYSITRQTPDRMERFVDLILAEAGINGYAIAARIGFAPARETVFFGGGTPSLLPAANQMRRLLVPHSRIARSVRSIRSERMDD